MGKPQVHTFGGKKPDFLIVAFIEIQSVNEGAGEIVPGLNRPHHLSKVFS
jgi:hypothetical protein